MKKGFKSYLIVWIVLFVIFNLVCFLTPSELDGMSIFKLASLLGSSSTSAISSLGISDVVYNKYGGAFFAGYILIVIGFVAQLVCMYFACSEENSKKFFLRIPLITISYYFLIASVVVGAICIVYPEMPLWFGMCITAAVAVFEFVVLFKSKAAGDIISDKDDEIKARTSFIRNITAEAKDLMDTAEAENRNILKAVYEEFRYSDPMSSVEIEYIEKAIQEKFIEVKLKLKDKKEIKDECNELVVLIKERNAKCKASK